MKKVIYNIGYVLLSMMLVLQSCADQIIPDNPLETSNELVPIALDFSSLNPPGKTYSTDYPNAKDSAGSVAENRIDDITVYIFDDTYTCERIMTMPVVINPLNPLGTDTVMVKVGTKHFVTVCNMNGKVPPTMYPPDPNNPGAVNYNTLRQTLTNAISVLPASPFLMVGDTLNVPITEQVPLSNPKRINIKVERAVAKVKVSFTKSAKAAAATITMQNVSLNKGADRIYLFTKPATGTFNYNLSSTKTTFTPSNIVQETPVYISLADSFYTYAVVCGKDTTNAVRIEFEAAVNSATNIRKGAFFLGEYINGSDTTYDIRRNYWYDVRVNIKDPGMDSVYVEVRACPWNVADAQEEKPGEGAMYVTMIPFKLVKNYTVAELSGSNSTFAAIDTHSKGASWIDITATNGTQWNLYLNDPLAPRNQGVIVSKDNGATWTSTFPVSGTGDDFPQRVYIYRPYVENNEPDLGPSLNVTLGTPPSDKFQRSFIIQPRDTLPIPTNCYIMRPQNTAPLNETRVYIPLAGVFSHWENYLLANGSQLPDGVIYADVLWDDSPSTDKVVDNVLVINSAKRDSAYLYAEAGIPGNAVVAIRIGSPTNPIRWSYHLWVTEYNPYEAAGQLYYSTSANVRNVFMDRSLGAMYNKFVEPGQVRGLHYQYGRKDPFPRGENFLNSPLEWYGNGSATRLNSPTLSLISPTAAAVLRPKTAIPDAIMNPRSFIPASFSPLIAENPNLWHTEGLNKTAYDPCPEGWRVPYYNPMAPPYSDISTSTTLAIPEVGSNSYHLGYFPHGGYYNQSGQLEATTAEGYWWTSFNQINGTATATIAQAFGIEYYTTPFYNYVRGSRFIDTYRGCNIRCVVDRGYLKNVGNSNLFGNEVSKLKLELLP